MSEETMGIAVLSGEEQPPSAMMVAFVVLTVALALGCAFLPNQETPVPEQELNVK